MKSYNFRMNRVSLKQVAARAGLAISTVSHILRGEGRFPEETAARVRALAKEMGYVPNAMLASLATARFRKSGDTVPLALLQFRRKEGATPLRIIHAYTRELLAAAPAMGYSTEVFSGEEMQRPSGVLRMLYHRGVQGLVILGDPEVSLFEDADAWRPFAVVQCGRYSSLPPVHQVHPDIFGGMRWVCDQVAARGYRRVGFALCTHTPEVWDDEVRLGSVLAFQGRMKGVMAALPPFLGGFDDGKGLLAWVGRERPDAVVGFSLAQYWHLKEAGLRMPGDLAFAALHGRADVFLECCMLCQDTRQVARQSLLWIDSQIRHGERGLPDVALEMTVPSRWHEGRTLPDRSRGPVSGRVKARG